MKTEDTFVLIVGGGPVGLAAANELGWRGIPAILVSENLETAKHPKCNSTNARSMEHFRRLGIAADIRAKGLPSNFPRDIAYVTRFCGYELGRRAHPAVAAGAGGAAAGVWQTPELPLSISQLALEPVLKRAAEGRRSVSVRFGCRLVSFSAHDRGITAEIEDIRGGERRRVHAEYMLAADGARSMVRRTLGIGMEGENGKVQRAFMGGTMLSYYVRAPGLFEASGRPRAVVNWIVNRELRGFMFTQDARETWIVHYQVPPGTDWRSVDGPAIVRAMLGADLPFEIISSGPWTGGLALVAERYQADRIFLAGDAAHLFTPLGGFGMNTGIGDVMNLGWKLAAVHDGWAGAGLLDSFEAERRPIGLRNSSLGVQCARRMSAWEIPEDIEAPDADAGRTAFGAFCVADDAGQYATSGLQLGERYEASPIIAADAAPAPPDDWHVYRPFDRAGARLPHVFLPDGSSLYDALGPGFTLIGIAADPPHGLSAAAAHRGIPLTALRLDPTPDPLPYRSRFILVRPDQHIAWRGDDAPADPLSLIDRIRGGALAPAES